jgi:hypothetical protein
MKKLFSLLPMLLLTSCAEYLKNDYVAARPGFYRPSTPFEQGSEFGVLLTRPIPVITPEK